MKSDFMITLAGLFGEVAAFRSNSTALKIIFTCWLSSDRIARFLTSLEI